MDIDQGSIIYGMKSEVYPEVCCSGIIISASCDIANNKTPYVYCVTAVPTDEYFRTNVGFERIYKELTVKLRNKIENGVKGYSMNPDILMGWSKEDALKSISVIKGKKDKKDIEKVYDQLSEIKKAKENLEYRREFVKNHSDDMIRHLKKIDEGRIERLYLLPNQFANKFGAIIDDGVGYVVDFLEVSKIDMRYALYIAKGGIDKYMYDEYSDCEKAYFQSNFWMKEDNSFVCIEGSVLSPRREQILQRFSNCFIRIGIDRLPDSHYRQLLENI